MFVTFGYIGSLSALIKSENFKKPFIGFSKKKRIIPSNEFDFNCDLIDETMILLNKQQLILKVWCQVIMKKNN